MKTFGREILWNLPPSTAGVMYLLLVGVLLLFWWRILSRIRAYRRGRPEREYRLDRPGKRALEFLRNGLGQRKVLEKSPGGPIHLAIFSAFLALFLVTCIVAVEFDFGVRILDGRFYIAFKLFAETFGAVLIVGVVAALARRLAPRPDPPTRDADDLGPLLLILGIALTGFLVESLRIAATKPGAAPCSYVANAVARLFSGASVPDLLRWHRGIWWTHLLLAFGFVAAVPYGKMLHAIAGPANIYLRSFRPAGALQPIPDFDGLETLGAGAIGDFSWKQLLDLDACSRCGRCEAACPAHATGKSLSPQKVIRTLGERSRGRDGTGVPPEDIWACTACGHCQAACPMLIEHVETIVDLRRHLVLGKSAFPAELEPMFRNLELHSDPWGFGLSRRLEWAVGMELEEAGKEGKVDLAYWVGCAGAFDERYRSVARSMTRILATAGIRFVVLGSREHCCGDFARRTGNEYLFHSLARKNVATLKECGVSRIVTSCPHCHNALGNEYANFGAGFEVIDHTTFLLDLLDRGAIRASRSMEKTVAYHDPCYLGRYHGIHEPPRRVLSGIAGIRLAEAGRSRKDGFCCGAGGGHLWLPSDGARINERRASELLSLLPDIVATACPHCLYMLEDGIRGGEAGSAVPECLDLAEILARAL